MQGDPLVNEFEISVKEPETVSRFIGKLSYKTTQTFKDINFTVFNKVLSKHKQSSITIDIDSSVINMEVHQEGAAKGYNPIKLGNLCYNIQFTFCDELKAYFTGFLRSVSLIQPTPKGGIGAAEMSKEIVANITCACGTVAGKTDDLEILFRMDSGNFDKVIIETIELLECKYLIKGKEYPPLVSQVTDPPILFVIGDEGRETAELLSRLNTWKNDRRITISRILILEKDRAQLPLLEGDEYQYFS